MILTSWVITFIIAILSRLMFGLLNFVKNYFAFMWNNRYILEFQVLPFYTMLNKVEIVSPIYFPYYCFKKHISCKYVVIFEVWCNMKAVQTKIVHYASKREDFLFFHSLMQECYYGVYFISYWYYLHHSSYRCPFNALDPIDVLLYSRVTESFESYNWITRQFG